MLNIGHEPTRNLSDAEVVEILEREPSRFLSYMLSHVQSVQRDHLQVTVTPKTIFTDQQGDFRVMPCVIRGSGESRKTVKVIGTNYVQRAVPQISPGKLLMLDAVENYVAWSIDACAISSARTGVLPAVVTRMLKPNAKRAWVCGAGRVGYFAASYLGRLSQIEQVVVCDMDMPRARETIEDLKHSGCPAQLELGEPGEWTIGQADVLVLATTSAVPVFFEDGSTDLVVSLGADAVGLREVDVSAAGRKLFIDTMDATMLGDLPAWIAESAGAVQPEPDHIWRQLEPEAMQTVVVSTGSAIMDNLAAGFVTANAKVN